MAKVFSAPIEAPEFKYETWEADEKKYVESVRNWLKANGYTSDYAGELVYFPFADGHAVYMIASLKPAVLIHLAVGDAWSIPAAHIRGLTAKDLKTQVENRRALEKAFGK